MGEMPYGTVHRPAARGNGLHDHTIAIKTHRHHLRKQTLNIIMKRILIFLFSLCLLPAQSQLLWQVSGHGLTRPSYLSARTT